MYALIFNSFPLVWDILAFSLASGVISFLFIKTDFFFEYLNLFFGQISAIRRILLFDMYLNSDIGKTYVDFLGRFVGARERGIVPFLCRLFSCFICFNTFFCFIFGGIIFLSPLVFILPLPALITFWILDRILLDIISGDK